MWLSSLAIFTQDKKNKNIIREREEIPSPDDDDAHQFALLMFWLRQTRIRFNDRSALLAVGKPGSNKMAQSEGAIPCI